MANTTYDELLRQVESLRAENTHLKRELQDNSSHLTLLEGEATTMKDVLTNLQTSMDVENPDSSMADITSCYPEFQTPPPRIIPRDDNDKDLDQNSNTSSNDESSTEQTWAHLNASNPFRASNTQLDPKNRSDEDKSVEQLQLQVVEGGKRRRGAANNEDVYVVLQELDQERSTLLSEIEAEDKHCKWYYEQIDAINSKINTLPTAQSFNTQADVQRRQLEYDGQRLRKLLQDNLGSAEQIARRHDARLQRIRIIETEMLFMQQRHRQVDPDKRDSGTCDLLEGEEDAVVVSDASTNTLVSGDAFITNPHAEESHAEHGIVISGPNGTNFVTIATQTAAERTDNADTPPSALFHGGWVLPPSTDPVAVADMLQQDTASVMSFRSSNVSSSATSQASYPQQQQPPQGHPLGTKVEMVYSLLSMLGTHDKDDMSRTLLAMSSSQDSCIAMRQSGCLPLLIQLLHGSDKDAGLLGNTRGSKAARARAAAALHNIVHSHPDDKRGRREARVLRLLEQIRAHCDQLRCMMASEDGSEGNRSRPSSADIDHHPGPAIAALMKLSFDEEHRHAICTLGGLQAIAELLQLDHETNGTTSEQYNVTMRRYACMALTNLTFGDGTNKALLCSMKSCMAALVAQLQSPNEDLRQVAASVLRNLSWRADLASKKMLREVHSVTALMQASMQVKKESTLKSILSALWNLSAHCSENKADICTVDGALAFQVGILTYKSPSKTLAIIENGGGILRNVSSHIAVREDYRVVLREHGCLPILLKHLRSPSLTIVSNACGTLWNLSARCPVDQKALWEMGAVNMLRNLVHSKHKMISMGSAAALKNLLSARPALNMLEDNVFPKPNMPGLHARKAKALKEELESQHLTETCENLESPQGSPTEGGRRQKNRFFADEYADPRAVHGQLSMHGDMQSKKPRESPVSRSSSQDSIRSSQSGHSVDTPRMNPLLLRSKLLQERQSFDSRSPLVRSNGPAADGPNSRIIQAMQEVALHAGLDAENRDPYCDEARRASTGRHKASSSIPTFRGQPASVVTSAAQNLQGYSSNPEAVNNSKDHMNFSHLSQRMENLHLNLPDPDQDEPINYSIKYSEAQVSTQSEPTVSHSSQRPNNQLSSSTGSAFTKPTAKLHNYVGGVHGYADAKSISQNTAGLKRSNHKANTNRIQQAEQQQQQFTPSSYTITDLDTDQPTNYGMRYAEEVEEEEEDEQEEGAEEEPINYSTRFTEPEESSTNVYVQEEALDDDQIRTFCTEGTPLNFMSTATSINDLTSANKQLNRQAPPPPLTAPKPAEILNLSTKADSELMSSTGSHSTDRNTSSTVITKKSSSPPTFTASPRQADESASSSHPPSLYSYNDNSTHTSSPSEKARQYCTEGTPTCFSRASSLSSLHSCDADATTATSSPQTSSSRPESHLQSIDENDSLNLTNNDVTLKPHDASLPSSANTTLNSTPGNGKTVTFDDNHQVQETPLMFSRCSSLGSLSSCDAHSVHSSVVSEYSRRESEVVSPSDLPASPSEPMPNSPPSLRKSPVKFVAGPPPVMKTTLNKQPPQVQQQKPMPMKPAQGKLFNDSPQHFADEGSPLGDFSCATSLSALTIDDDDVMIRKEASLRRIPLGQEEEEAAPLSTEQANMNDTMNTVIENQRQDLEITNLEDDDDDFSVSEGEENILAECISLAMPTKSSRKVKKSGSDGHLKAQTDDQKMPANRSMSRASKPHVLRPQDSEPQSGYDTPIKYATEDTPHNFSTTGSLSDLSLDSHKAGDGASMPDQNDLPTIKDDVDDDASDLSSLSGGDEALLSEAIQAAMPKSKKKLVMDRMAEGADVPEKQSLQGFKKPQQPSRDPPGRPAAYGDITDSVTMYAVEGTPINFSRRTSLSDLSVDSVPVSREPMEKVKATPAKAKGPTTYHDAASDSPRVFGMEGTPVSFSRNDSLSSLSCDEEDYAAVSRGAAKAKKPNLPAVSRLKTPVSKKPGPCTSTPMGRQEAAPRHSDDQIRTFAVEDTPACISRNSSLSSLNSEDHNDLKAQTEGQLEEAANQHTIGRGDATQGALTKDSKNSSLSSLSVESLSFDDTEDALLAECINSALPKSKKKSKKEPVMVRASPSGSSGATHPSSREDEGDSWPKNAEGPQAEKEKTESTPVEEEEEVEEDEQEEALVVKMTESEEFEKIFCLEAKKCAEVIEQEGEEMSDSESVITLSKEKAASVESLTMGCRPLDGMMSSDAMTDIMKESFPEMSSSLVSTITTPDELPNDVTMKDESTLQEEAFPKELTHSDEMLLEENANIILSELSLKMERSCSLLDEDLLNDEHIDMLSLVSNDYPSDDDDTQSQSSKAGSDEASSISESALVQHKGPRIVKPVNKPVVQDNAPKAIRGRRRPLSAPRNPVSSASAASQNKTKTVKPTLPKRSTSLASPRNNISVTKARLNDSKQNSSPGAKKTPPKMITKQGTSRSPLAKKEGGMPSPRGSSSSLSSQMASKPVTGKSPAKPTSISKSKIAVPSKLAESKRKTLAAEVERPGPLIKQNTFTKDTPTVNVPLITSDDKIEQEEHSSNRNSLSTEPENWSKTLEMYNFLVDSPDDTEEKSVVKKPELPKSKADTASKLSKLKSPVTVSPSKAKTGISKASPSANRTSNSAIKTSSSGASLNKSASGTSLTKTSSSGSLRSSGNGAARTPPRPALPPRNNSTPNRGKPAAKGEAQISPKKGSPPGKAAPSRSTSAGGSPANKEPPKKLPKPMLNGSGAGKKPAVSKIAGLWKKDPESESNVKKVPQVKLKPKKLAEQIKEPELLGISRSATYDKLEVGKELKLAPEETSVDDVIGSDVCTDTLSSTDSRSAASETMAPSTDSAKKMPPPLPPRNSAWKAATLPAELKTTEKTKPEKPSKPVKKSLSLFKRLQGGDAADKAKKETSQSSSKSETSSEIPAPKKKGFSLWRRDGKSNKGAKTQESKADENSEPPKVVFSNGSPLGSPTRSQAIVPPFNYKGPSKADGESTEQPSPLGSPSLKHLTKTEMLLARRRRSYLTSVHSEESADEAASGDGKKVLVTTV